MSKCINIVVLVKQKKWMQDLVSSHRSIHYIQNDQLRKNITLFSKTSPLEITLIEVTQSKCLCGPKMCWCTLSHTHNTDSQDRHLTPFSLNCIDTDLLTCYRPNRQKCFYSLKILLSCHWPVYQTKSHPLPCVLCPVLTCLSDTVPPPPLSICCWRRFFISVRRTTCWLSSRLRLSSSRRWCSLWFRRAFTLPTSS